MLRGLYFFRGTYISIGRPHTVEILFFCLSVHRRCVENFVEFLIKKEAFTSVLINVYYFTQFFSAIKDFLFIEDVKSIKMFSY